MDLRQAWELAEQLVADHGLKDWRVVIDRAKVRAGACRYDRREISLSAELTRLHPEQQVRDTILHEIAHALVGPGHRHDGVWRAKALEIGCSAQRCVSAQAPRVPGPWVGTCSAGHTVERHRRPERPQSCARCSRRFEVRHLFEWTRQGQLSAMHPNYVSALRALKRGESDPSQSLRPGHEVRIVAPGEFYGVTGLIARRGRSRYQIKVPGATISVPFALVRLVG